jgi:hypothetical protein
VGVLERDVLNLWVALLLLQQHTADEEWSYTKDCCGRVRVGVLCVVVVLLMESYLGQSCIRSA